MDFISIFETELGMKFDCARHHRQTMARLRLILSLATLLSTVTAESLNTANKQATLTYLPPFGVCHDIPGDSTSSICPVYGPPTTNQSSLQTKEDTISEKEPPSPPTQGNQPSQSQSQPQSEPTSQQQTQPNQQQAQPKKEEKKASSPWSRGAICRRVGQDDFCAFTHSSFNNGEGISVITTPLIFVGLSTQAPLNAPVSAKQSAESGNFAPYKDVSVPGKGIGLVATEPIRSGKRIMARTPAVMVDDRAFRGLRKDDLALLLAQAILALPDLHRDRFMNLSSSHDSHSSSSTPGVPEEQDAKAQAKKKVDLIYQIFTTNAFKTTVKVAVPDESAPQTSSPGKEQEIGKKIKDIDFHSTFTEVSRLNHDCAPNLGYYFDTATLSHKVYAVSDIYPGEELSVSYVDVLHPRETRKKLLKATWGFDCSCERCGGPHSNSHSHHKHDDQHLLDESDSRVEQINALRRELDNYSPPPSTGSSSGSGSGKTIGTGTPTKALLLITLYNLEGAQVRIYEAYYRAALEYNGVGDTTNAMIYARMCLDKGLIARGPDRPFITSMKELIKDPTKHWSWRFRLADTAKGDSQSGDGKTEGQAEKPKQEAQPQAGDGEGGSQ
ncbi:SET domain containing protein [Naviculisporaceae sp. PSN 640]